MNINAVQPVESIYLEEGLDDISGKIQGLMRHHRVITENEYAIGNSIFLLYHDYHGDRNQCYTATFCIHAFNVDCSMMTSPDNRRMACSECTDPTLADTWKSIDQDSVRSSIRGDFILDTEEHRHDGCIAIMAGTVFSVMRGAGNYRRYDNVIQKKRGDGIQDSIPTPSCASYLLRQLSHFLSVFIVVFIVFIERIHDILAFIPSLFEKVLDAHRIDVPIGVEAIEIGIGIVVAEEHPIGDELRITGAEHLIEVFIRVSPIIRTVITIDGSRRVKQRVPGFLVIFKLPEINSHDVLLRSFPCC